MADTYPESASWIEVSNGVHFDIAAPAPALLNLEDIALSLAQQPRFLGRMPLGVHLSIAEHCVNVAAACPEWCRLEGLLHDASEAFMADIPSPHKQLYPDYEAIEDRVMAAVTARWNLICPIPGPVHAADRAACMSEALALGMDVGQWPGTRGIMPLRAPLFLSAWEAHKRWLGAVRAELAKKGVKE